MPFNPVTWTAMLLKTAPDSQRVVFGRLVTYGVLDDDEQLITDEMGQPVTVRTRQITIAATSLTGLQDGSTLTIGGTAYVVRGRPMPKENGDLWTVRVTA